MGVTFTTIFESAIPPRGAAGSDHTVLARRKDDLDRLAGENGLTPLGAFEGYEAGDLASIFSEEDLEGVALPEVEWFDAAAGVAAVRALLGFLRASGEATAAPADLLDELSDVEAELADAERAAVRFRFAMVP